MKLIYFISFIFLTVGCSVVINLGNGYDGLENSIKSNITTFSNFKTLSIDSIYEITGNQLIDELKNYDSSLVYIFKGGCNSEYCIPLSSIEHYATKNKLKLFLVLTGYYNLSEIPLNNLGEPVFSINASHYGSSTSKKYISEFLGELGYFRVMKTNKINGAFLLFKQDTLIEIKREIY